MAQRIVMVRFKRALPPSTYAVSGIWSRSMGLRALKRADVTYEELAERLKEHGFAETKAGISNKLARATVPASFFLACLAALELGGVRLEDI
jgi:Domain of unknown function (DUF6471)